MSTPKALVLRAAGTNCDMETQYALELAGFSAERIHIFRIMEKPELLDPFSFIVFPGGFSYGDDVAAGKILANQMIHNLAEPLNRFAERGGLILGICNGFQILIKSGLLPGGRVDPATAGRDATLAWNDCGQFIDKWIYLRAESDKCVFIKKGEVIALPIAHGEGKFVTREASILSAIKENDQVALRYCDANGDTSVAEANPNGSQEAIAGICDATGRVMGLMPHPERFVEITQHPSWTRGGVDKPAGLDFFTRAFATVLGNAKQAAE